MLTSTWPVWGEAQDSACSPGFPVVLRLLPKQPHPGEHGPRVVALQGQSGPAEGIRQYLGTFFIVDDLGYATGIWYC